ncbi:hypothetical protein BE17_27005 [Sorangium cellulosum]|uniref:Uncharacterized protein n=1 Tax=Sorangium cellulosum TaxID=56 RepID=A0A150R7R9_SORCE|nr:hypothetical protein BE17_27005 [Sorangium cellulosum]
MASPAWKVAACRAERARAQASWPSEGSMPSTLSGAHSATSSSVKAPLPQPTSSHWPPAGGDSQSRKAWPTRWLDRPMKRS